MPKMGDLATQDSYGDVDWSRMNAPFGQLLDPNPKLYDTKAGPIYQADINQAIDVGMGVSGGGLSTRGIKAYHASPHDFDKFDLARIGTGEGAQVYGHGLYFAENPAVSGQGGQYWKQFLNRFAKTPEGEAAAYLQSMNFDRAKALENARIRQAADEVKFKGNPELERQREAIRLLESGKPVGPRTYEVNIKADPAHMLDWDKPLRAQPHIQDVLADRMLAQLPGKAGVRALRAVNEEVDALGGKAGDILYRNFSTKPREASAILNEAGIPGIKYLDQGSRNATPVIKADKHGNVISSHYPPLTSNYVVFDPSIIDIMKKYGIAGAAPTAMGALAATGNEAKAADIEDRRKRRVPPELSTGEFSAGLPVPNVFAGNGGLLTGLGSNDFAPIQDTPLARAAGTRDLDAIMGALAAQDTYRGE